MEWLVFALIGQFLLAFALVFGKIIRTKIVPSSLIYMIYAGFVSSVVFLLIPFVDFAIPTKMHFFYIFLTSLPYTIGLYLLIKSFTLEEVSRIIIFRQLQPVFVLILATLFLNEVLTKNQYFGFFLLFGGSIIASYKSGNSLKALPSRAFWLITIQTFLWAIYFIMSKFTYTAYGFWNTIIFVRLFFLFYSIVILFYLISRKRFDFKKVFTKGMAFLGFNEFMVVVAVIFLQFAVSLAPASLVSITESTKPIFVLFIASMFSIKFPKLLKEEISRKIIFQKIVAIVLIIIGFVFLNL